MKKVIEERRTRVQQDELVKISDDIVRDFAEFSSLMMNDQFAQ